MPINIRHALLAGATGLPIWLTAQCAVCFSPAVNYAVGANPYGIATADFNNDGFTDLVAANWGASTVSLLLGSGTGTFGAATNFTVGTNPRSIVAGDFNLDGKMDFATCNDGSVNVTVRLGNGLGGFGAAANYPVAAAPECIVKAYFNADGNLDLATANYGSLNTSILLGTGTGTFGAATNYSTGAGSFPYGLCTADFNLDSRADLVAVSYSSNNLYRLLGNGTGGMGASTSYGTGSTGAYAVCAADFTGDGRADLAVANANTNNISRLTTSGTGTFGAAVTYGAGSFPFCITSADFNLDAKMDLAVGNYSGNDVSVLMGMGTGAFCTAVNYGVGTSPTSVCSADFNGDGKPDLALTNNNSNNVSVLLNCSTPLSQDLLRFECKASDDSGNHLEWAAAHSLGAEAFLLERSADGASFEPLATLASDVSLTPVQEFTYTDHSPVAGQLFYRLTALLQDGGMQELHVTACGRAASGETELRVFSMNGQQLYAFKCEDCSSQLEDLNLPRGIYLLEVRSEGRVEYRKHLPQGR